MKAPDDPARCPATAVFMGNEVQCQRRVRHTGAHRVQWSARDGRHLVEWSPGLIDDLDFEKLADEAERGYDVATIREQRRHPDAPDG